MESLRFHLTQRKNLDKAHLSLEWNSFDFRKTKKMRPYRLIFPRVCQSFFTNVRPNNLKEVFKCGLILQPILSLFLTRFLKNRIKEKRYTTKLSQQKL